VKPIPTPYYASMGEAADPAYYMPKLYRYRHPPTLTQFLSSQHHLTDRLKAVLVVNDWPLVDALHKAASVALKDAAGREVGRVDIGREHLVENERADIPVVLRSTIEQAIKGYKLFYREPLRKYLEGREHAIRAAALVRSPHPTEDDVLAAIRDEIKRYKERAKAQND
jgi:regulator of protease activity HflC (stomatin/prohibitin superfamily)